MTAGAWLLLATALALWPARAAAVGRLERLVAMGRARGSVRRSWLSRVRQLLDPARPSPGSVLAAALVVAVLFSVPFGPLVALAAASVTALAGYVVGALAAARASRRSRDQALNAARTLLAELQAGTDLAAALGAAAASAPMHAASLDCAAQLCAAGEDGSPELVRVADLAAMGHGLRIVAVSGAAITQVVDAVVQDLLDTRRRDEAVESALAGPRSSAVMLAGLPLIGLGLGIAMGADPVAVLTGTPIGRAVLAAGVVLDCLGAAWTMRIVQRAQRTAQRSVRHDDSVGSPGEVSDARLLLPLELA